MARIKLSPLIASISGSVAGGTFQRGKFGTVLRTKPLPLARRSESQSLVRSKLYHLEQQWYSFSLAQRDYWARLASFVAIKSTRNKQVSLSGYLLFLKWNMYRLLAGLSVDNAPDFLVLQLGTIEPAIYVPQSELFAAAGESANTLAYADELSNWSDLGTSTFSTTGNGIASNGSRFVAVGKGGVSVAYSDNGNAWSPSSGYSFGDEGHCVIWDGTRFIIGGNGSTCLAQSSDGSSVSYISPQPFTQGVYALCFNGSVYVAGGYGAITLAYSFNGITWFSLGSSTFNIECTAIAWNGRLFLAGGYANNLLATSPDGVNWTPVSSPPGFSQVFAIIWDGNKFIIGGSGTVAMAVTVDAVNFTVIVIAPYLSTCLSITYNGNAYYAAGSGSNKVLSSYDGISWAPPYPEPSMSACNGIAGIAMPGLVPPSVYEHEFDPGHNLYGADKWLILKLSRPVPANAPFNKRLLKQIALGSPQSSSYSIGDAYFAVHGISLKPGDRVWCEMVVFALDAPIIYPIVRSLITVEIS